MYDEVVQKLKDHKDFRERKMKNYFLSILALRKLGIVEGHVLKDTPITLKIEDFKNFGPMFSSYDRLWRKATKENAELRGQDYGDGEQLEQQAQIELGYIPDYEESRKYFGL